MSYLSDLLGDVYKEGMSEDELSEALESAITKREEGSNAELTRMKNALSKANSEAAGYKKDLRAKMSEAEATEATRKEEWDKIVKENAELNRKIALSEKKASLLGIGYDEKLAEETATAMVDGDMEKVIANQGKFLEAQKKNIIADAMKGTPRPGAGAEEGGGIDYSKEIATARQNGDLSAVAYYMRLQQEAMKLE